MRSAFVAAVLIACCVARCLGFPGANVTVAGESGYAAFRIPGMATYIPRGAPRDTASMIVAVAEGRKFGCDDLLGQHDLMLARSLDGGVTWDGRHAPRTIVDAATGVDPGRGSNQSAVWDPTPVYDATTGVLFVFFAWSATPAARLHGENHLFYVASPRGKRR